MRDIIQLEKVGRQIRRDIIQMTALAGSGHPGGSLSATDLMAGTLLRDSKRGPIQPMKEDRDRIIYSKAHVTRSFTRYLQGGDSLILNSSRPSGNLVHLSRATHTSTACLG